jgi:hypothetical protein
MARWQDEGRWASERSGAPERERRWRDEWRGRDDEGRERENDRYRERWEADQYDPWRGGARDEDRPWEQGVTMGEHGRRGEYGRGGGYSSGGYTGSGYGSGGGYSGAGGDYRGAERFGRGWHERSLGEAFPEHGPGGYRGHERAYGWADRDAWRAREGHRQGEEGRGLLGRMGERVREGIERMKGRGPKGYRRSDDRIHDDVCERIARSGLEADEVEVKVQGGEVTLSGTVRTRQEKRWLEDVVEDVFGVDEVHNHLRLHREHEGEAAQRESSEPRLPH